MTSQPPLPGIAKPLGTSETAWPSRRVRWVLLALCLAALFAPPFVYEDDVYRRDQFTKFAALAILALSLDLIWGYTGLLSLGQGLYFGLGAYAMGYSLILQKMAIGENPLEPNFTASPDMAMPGFMAVMGQLTEVPFWIRPFINIWFALAVAILLPALLATLFGLVTFRLRIKGVFFALITQVLILALYLVVVRNLPYTGGDVGMIGLPWLNLFGIYQFENSFQLYFLIAGILVLCFLGSYWLVNSKFGKLLTAIRDNENRVLAMGYNTMMYKTFIFALAGGMSGLSGALYVAANRTCGPDFLKIEFSVEAVILVAVGGRGTLIGAILGAFLVRFANAFINDMWSEGWRFIQGGLFIGVVLFLPEGIMGAVYRLADRCRRWVGHKALADPDSFPAEPPGKLSVQAAGPNANLSARTEGLENQPKTS